MFEYLQANSPAAKAHLDSQFSMFTDLSKQIFSAMQRFNELNIQVVQTIWEETLANTKQIMCAKDLNEALAIMTGQVQPNTEKLRAYQQHLADIAAGTQVNLAKSAESHIQQTTRTAQELVSEVAHKASEDTEKATQRQRATMDKITTPIGKSPEAGKGGAPGVH